MCKVAYELGILTSTYACFDDLDYWLIEKSVIMNFFFEKALERDNIQPKSVKAAEEMPANVTYNDVIFLTSEKTTTIKKLWHTFNK